MPQPSDAASSSASGADSVSHHSLEGRITWWSASSATRPCCCPLTPMPRTESPTAAPVASLASASAAVAASCIASTHTDGCCSARPRGAPSGLGLRPYDTEPTPSTLRALAS
eukprot:6971044-Prymnesium_polylepis.1